MLLITLNFSIREYNCSIHRERTTQSLELGHILSDTCQLVILGKSLYLDVNVGGNGAFEPWLGHVSRCVNFGNVANCRLCLSHSGKRQDTHF